MKQRSPFLNKIGWYRFSVKARIILCVISLGVVQSICITWLGLNYYSEDREAYLYENHWLKMNLVFRNLLAKINESRKFYPLNVNPNEIKKRYQLPRLPFADEKFIVKGKGRFYIIRNKKNKIQIASLPALKKLCPLEVGTCYFYNSFGTFFDSNSRVWNEKNIARNNPIQTALNSFLSTGFQIHNYEKQDIRVTVAFKNLEKTNLMVLIETESSDILENIRKFIREGISVAVILVLISSIILYFVMIKLLSPIAMLLKYFYKMGKGNFRIDFNYFYRDEFRKLFKGLALTANELDVREKKIDNMRQNIEDILEITKKLTLIKEPKIALSLVAESIVSKTSLSDKTMFFYKSLESESPLEDVLLLGNGKAIEQKQALDIKEKPEKFYIKSKEHSYGLINIFLEKDIRLGKTDSSFINSLLASFAIILENISNQNKIKDLAMLDYEVATAGALQSTLLSGQAKIPGLNYEVYYQPSQKAGGDWYGSYYDPNTFEAIFCVGDATGHGLPPAMLTGNTCGAFYAAQSLLTKGQMPLEDKLRFTAQVLNEAVYRARNQKIAMTACLVGLNISTGKGTLLSLGHTSSFVLESQKGKAKTLMAKGGILGIEPNISIQRVCHFSMEINDRIFLYTDGLIENTGPNGEMFSKRSLRNSLEQHVKAEKYIPELLKEAEAVWNEFPGEDDITLMSIQLEGSK